MTSLRSAPRLAERASMEPEECLVRLSQAGIAHLACTRRAMPVLLPVTVSLIHGEIIVQAPPGAESRLDGQVVALGNSRQATRWRHGWHVVAVGRLTGVGAGTYALQPQDIQGWRLTSGDPS